MSRTRRIVVRIALTLVLVVAICAGLIFAMLHKFYPNPPLPNATLAQDTASAQRQDFEYFQNYLELNRAYSPEAREKARQLLAQYVQKAGTFTQAQFDLAISRMVALSDNGHSRVQPGPLSRQHPRLPCRLYRFDDGFRVLRARGACLDLLGAKITALDGRPIAEVVDGMYEYFSGPRNHYDQFASVFFLESPELLQAAGFAIATDRVALHAQLRDGSERDVSIVAEPAGADASHAYSLEYLSPQRLDKESADWVSLLAADAQLPLFLRDYNNPFQTEFWPDKKIYYAQFRSNQNEPGHPIGDFVARIEREITADRPRSVIVDLRLNQGGNFTTTAALMKNFATLTDSIEHVYVLTSAWTFSAGDVSLALLKDRGADKVTVIGTLVGDRIRMWGEGGNLTLPNSKLNIGFSTGMHDYSHSCWGEPGCFWVMYFYPMHVSSFEPDVVVGYTFDDYIHLRDPLLDRTLALAEGKP